MKKNKLLNVIGNVFFYVVLVSLLSVSFITLKSCKEGKQPSIMGNKFFTVLTGSMEPTIMTGDLIISKETPSNEIREGDIITFGSLNSNNITTHRVKEVVNNNGKIEYVTQGDANNVRDPNNVHEEVLIGKVVKCVPKLGNVMAWMKSHLGLIMIVIFLIIVITVMRNYLQDRFKKIDEEEKDEN